MAKQLEQIHYFYVVICADRTLYAGYTNRLTQRIETHNIGKGAKYTKPEYRRPVRLIYAERYEDKRQAMRQEYRFKQLTRLQKITYLKQQGLADLYSGQCIIVNGKESASDADST